MREDSVPLAASHSRSSPTDANGKDMELVGRAVDITVVRPVGESYSGTDSPLDAAVKALLASLPGRQ